MSQADPPDSDGDDLPDEERHAADDPTAVWDAESLRAAGLEDVLAKPETDPPPAATAPQTKGQESGPSIVAEGAVEAAPGSGPKPASRDRADATPREPHRVERPTPRPPARTEAPQASELSWGATIALAVGLAAIVYFAVRFLK